MVDEDEAALVRRIFALCLEGHSIRAIARILTEERVATPSDRHPERGRRKSLPHGVWSHPTVRAILRYQGYTGEAAWGKRERLTCTTTRARPVSAWVSFRVPAIIDGATFQAAQEASTRHKALARRNRKHEYLFVSAQLRCGRCGRGMSGFAVKRRFRYYHCNSHHSVMDPALRCLGNLRADVIEAQVWEAIMRVLEQPELIAAEVARQERSADAQRAEVGRQLALIDAALTKCDREAQRWANAYAAEVISLVELKGYRAEIETRRRTLMAEQTEHRRQLDAIGESVHHVEALTEYCRRVHQRLQTFDHAEKQVALKALDIRVSWIPGQPFAIQGSIPLGAIVNNPPRRVYSSMGTPLVLLWHAGS